MAWSFRQVPLLVAGPCTVESGEVMQRVAAELARLGATLGIPVCFKASFDKANRGRLDAPRGPGLEAGLEALRLVKQATGLPLLTDIHEPAQAAVAAQVVDALQVPAFLCRQTDLLLAAGRTGLPVNVKKGQWMAPAEIAGAVEKARAGGSADVSVTERGTFFGYGDLVVDMRSFTTIREVTGAPVLFDATHAVQQPGRGAGGQSGGRREQVPPLLLAAAASGADGFYLETHPDPAHAISDRASQWPLKDLHDLVSRALDVWNAAREGTARLPGGAASGHD